MNIEISYSKSALSFFSKNQNMLTRDDSDMLIIKAAKKIFKLSIESIDIKTLKGFDETYRIRKGDIRIIFRIDKDGNVIVVFVNHIDYRGSVYKK